jgi:hypothetical protein
VSLLVDKIKYGVFKAEELRGILSHKTLPSGGYGSSPGEAPPALLILKKLFARLKTEINNAAVSAIVDECIDSIDANIKDGIDRDEIFRIGR